MKNSSETQLSLHSSPPPSTPDPPPSPFLCFLQPYPCLPVTCENIRSGFPWTHQHPSTSSQWTHNFHPASALTCPLLYNTTYSELTAASMWTSLRTIILLTTGSMDGFLGSMDRFPGRPVFLLTTATHGSVSREHESVPGETHVLAEFL